MSQANPLVRVMGRNGITASHHYLASAVGVEIMRKGGNAIDAAIAVSAALGVVEPAMTGPAGTGNMLIFTAGDGQAHCLDFSGRAPSHVGPITAENLYFGATAPMVPGSVGGWLTALGRFGTMDPSTVLGPAIGYAEGGFPVSETLSYYIRRMAPRLRSDPAAAAIWLPDGTAPEPGSMLRQTDLGATLRAIAGGGAEAFYRGAIADRIIRCLEARGGWLSAEDLRSFEPEWQAPLVARYRGWSIMTPPPPCSGIQILETLRILEATELSRLDPLSTEYVHLLIEAIKLARHDRVSGGSAVGSLDVATYLSEPHVARLRDAIASQAAPSDGDWFPSPQHTTHFCVGDAAGNLVSSTQTLGAIFGSGLVVEGTGLMLNGLLFLFDADPSAPNHLAPNKRVDLVMAPVLARGPDGTNIVVGSPGGQGSLQTIVQMLVNVIDFGMTPQQAVEAPRFLSYGRRAFIDKFGPDHDPTALAVEDRIPIEVRDELARRGHSIELLGAWSHAVGAGAMVSRRPNGVLEGGTDPRRDGLTSAY